MPTVGVGGVKRNDFIRELQQAGCELHRHGKRHDIYPNLANGRKLPFRDIAKLPIPFAK